MAMRGIAPLCIFCIICIICIISGGIRGDAASGGVVSVCWRVSCANADAAGTIANILVAQRTAIMEANFMGRSLVAKNVKLIIAVFETLILLIHIDGCLTTTYSAPAGCDVRP